MGENKINERKGLLSSGAGMVMHNKRYILWFYVLNVALAWFGAAAFSNQAHLVLDNSLVANRLVHGFDAGVLAEMFMHPEFSRGTLISTRAAAADFAVLFFVLTALFLPGVFQGYASTYRLPREDFFRACGRNLWRFIRLLLIAGLVMGIVAALLFAINDALMKMADESTNEKLSFEVQMTGLAIIFLVMTVLRIWFDLAEVDVVLNDQRAVRKSIGAAFRHTFRNLGRLLVSYVVATIAAAVILVGGLLFWRKAVRPENVLGAVLVSQLTLLLLLIPRFWQRGVAVTYWQQEMLVPMVAMQPATSYPVVPRPIEPAPVPTDTIPEAAPAIPNIPPEPQ
jgi:hypothetical protein